MRRAILATAFVLTLTCIGVFVASQSPQTSVAPMTTSARCYEIQHGTEARECYVESLEISDVASLPALFSSAQRLLSDPITGSHFAVECHEVMHDLGKSVEQRFGPVDLSYAPAAWCANGFQHGAIEIRLSGVSDTELVSLADDWCTGQDQAVCRHLVGHVAMRRPLEAGRGMSEAEQFAIDVCGAEDSFSDRTAALHAFRCLDGAYMERALWVMRIDFTAAESPPLTHCEALRSVNTVAASACTAQVGPLLYEHSGGADAALAVCRSEASTEAAAVSCVYSVANAIVAFSEDPVSEARRLCTGADFATCAAGFARAASATTGPTAAAGVCMAVAEESSDLCLAETDAPYPFEY